MRSRKTISLVLALTLLLSAVLVTSAGAAPQQAGAAETYIVLYNAQSVPADAAASIAAAGGTLVYRYDQIGVAIARSGNASFRSNLLKDSRINGTAATTGFATQLNDDAATSGSDAPVTNTPAPGNDTLSGR
jgi:lantibiotic leader peptide-processing serine protease